VGGSEAIFALAVLASDRLLTNVGDTQSLWSGSFLRLASDHQSLADLFRA
jgi:hypothetical protein